jgi:magnesium-transporting ATPase (P-type)
MDQVARIRKKSLIDTAILSRAVADSFRKLSPRKMAKNPVMFVVEVGALLTAIQLVWNAAHHAGQFGFGLQITLWLWFTVLFANFAEAMAEGRGKAQADTLRKARAETQAHRLGCDGTTEVVPSSNLRSGDIVVVTARSSKVLRRWTSPPSQVNLRPSFANREETVLRSPVAQEFSPMKSRCASHLTLAKRFSIA